MKPKTLNLLNLCCCLLLNLALQSCSSEIGAWKNQQIKESRRNDLHEMSDKVFGYIKTQDTKNLEGYLSKEMIEEAARTSALSERISHELRMDSFIRATEYYVVNKYIETDTIAALDEGTNSHRLIYPGESQEMYMVMWLPQNKSIANQSMITAVYAHYDYGWKLSSLDLGTYTINGKTAPEHYKIALEEYRKNHLVPAVNEMMLSTSCAHPNNIWKYTDEDAYYKFASKVINEANDKYKFPYTLAAVSTKPRLIGFFNDTSIEGTYPMISYLTKVSLKDITGLQKEKEEIKKIIGTVMPGIDKSGKYLIYAAYNEMPVRTKNVAHYDIKEKL